MGFTTTTQQLTVTVFTSDGNGGFWIARRDSSNNLYELGYVPNNSSYAAVNSPFGFNTFREILVAMITNNVNLPANELGININSLIDLYSLGGEFDENTITNGALLTIHTTYGAIPFCEALGILVFVARYFVGGLITLSELADIYIYLGQTRKATWDQVETEVDQLITDGHVTQAQKSSFRQRWINEVN